MAYGPHEAVRGIDLAVRRGEVFALLGPNGAGKTTTVEILEGHRSRTGGTVEVLGHDPARHERAYKERIGIVLQSTGIDRYLTVGEAVDMFRGYYPHPRPREEVLALVGLEAQRDERVRRLSGGQQRRLNVAIGLAGDPDLMFLDEPTTGFDPAARRQAWEMIRNLRSTGTTVFLTTHYLDEAEQLADRVAIIAGGRIIAEGSPQSLASGQTRTVIQFRMPAALCVLPVPPEVAEVADDGRVRIETAEPTRTLLALTRWAGDAGVELPNLTVSRATLEDIYLQLVDASEAVGAAE
ncbi:MAG: ABC transporter ATP-binding protein [Chloroflexi bacterium]|nr:MAG: ABC transporter ATP-binding protein [Chloroflexota bacterium]